MVTRACMGPVWNRGSTLLTWNRGVLLCSLGPIWNRSRLKQLQGFYCAHLEQRGQWGPFELEQMGSTVLTWNRGVNGACLNWNRGVLLCSLGIEGFYCAHLE